MSFPVKLTLAVLGIVAVAFALLFLIRDSDEEAIEKLLQRGAEAASKQDAEGVIALLSVRFKSTEGDHAWAVQRIRRLLSQGVGTVEVSPAGIVIDGEDASARVGLRAKAGPYGVGETRVDFRFRKENGVWKVTGAEEIR
jgi:hypothetical protein